MSERLRELAGRVDAGIERLLGQMRSMTPRQRAFRPGDDAWSPNQVAHHLLLVQSLSVGTMEKNRGRRSARPSPRQRLARLGVGFVLRYGIKVRNPAPPTTPDPEITFEELEPRWSAERDRLQALLGPLDDSALADAGFKHPISGPLDLGGSLDFLARHLEHHLRQLDRIRATSDFPPA